MKISITAQSDADWRTPAHYVDTAALLNLLGHHVRVEVGGAFGRRDSGVITSVVAQDGVVTLHVV